MIGEVADLHDGRTIEGPDLTTDSEYMGVVEVTGLRPATNQEVGVINFFLRNK